MQHFATLRSVVAVSESAEGGNLTGTTRAQITFLPAGVASHTLCKSTNQEIQKNIFDAVLLLTILITLCDENFPDLFLLLLGTFSDSLSENY